MSKAFVWSMIGTILAVGLVAVITMWLVKKSLPDQNSRGGQLCIQAITRASNPKTGEEKDFPTPCDVPKGWPIVPPPSVDQTPSQNGQLQ